MPPPTSPKSKNRFGGGVIKNPHPILMFQVRKSVTEKPASNRNVRFGGGVIINPHPIPKFQVRESVTKKPQLKI
jgi:hypothetical protein